MLPVFCRMVGEKAVAQPADADDERRCAETCQKAVEYKRAANDDIGAFGFEAGDLAALGERDALKDGEG